MPISEKYRPATVAARIANEKRYTRRLPTQPALLSQDEMVRRIEAMRVIAFKRTRAGCPSCWHPNGDCGVTS
jgi:hypothetical protein